MYFVFLWAVTRVVLRTRERLRCPADDREANVLFLRAPDGCREDVVSCSLLEAEPDRPCAKQCLHPALG